LVTFGGLTGADVKQKCTGTLLKANIMIGSLGGTRRELKDLVDNHDKLLVKAWSKFSINNIKKAL
jgi:D-arabinose 1-dehydrogenase-like Zn-dependent alcohol dehydrogenase